ncbi:MAG: peptide chain release factor N(5)-glutamine methyltransferase [Bacteroidetes bacterium]|nr:peptide chain release factor N(5)-glutamine methyltransferase [Bacteroidota bacterium]
MQIAANTLQAVQHFFKKELAQLYTESELTTIMRWIFEKKLQLSAAQIPANVHQRINQSDLIVLEQMCYQLKKHTPIQYVLGEAEFYRLKFQVNPSVLIPRPETEELVELILKNAEAHTFLDIGTGSGCIPVSIKKNKAQARVYALDISDEALHVAQQNALINKAEVCFFKADILSGEAASVISKHLHQQKIDLLVSNPPYVLDSEKEGLEKRVKNHEPALALFVKDSDPLLFYRKIAKIAPDILAKNGKIYFECHTNHAQEVYNLLVVNNFKKVCLARDMAQMPRFVWASI